MKKLVLLLCVLSAVGCVKSYEDYYTRAFVLKYESMYTISVGLSQDNPLEYHVIFVGNGTTYWGIDSGKRELDFYNQLCEKHNGVSGISSIWRCGVPPTGMPNILRGRRSTIWLAFPAIRPGPIFRAAIRKNTMNN